MSHTHVYIEIKDVGMIFAYTRKYNILSFLIIYYITFTHIHILLYNHIHIFSYIYIYTHPLTLTMGCCGEIWLLDKDGVAQRWEKEKLGIANFWKLPTFLFFQENMVSILGDSKHVLHAIAWSINVFPQGNAFSHIQEFSTGVSVVYVSLFWPQLKTA